MNKTLKNGTLFGLATGLSLLAAGCGGGSSSHNPTIVVYGGYYGYYSGTLFCDFTNDYCGTGLSYGIIDNGSNYNGCDVNNSCNNNGGTNNGSGNGSGNNGGSNNGSGNGSGNNGGGNNGSGNGGGNNGGGNNGGGNNSGGNNGSGNGTNNGTSFGSDVKDVDLQKADLQSQSDAVKARAVADHFQMSLEAATKLTQLSDKMVKLESAGQMTDEDRAALTTSAMSAAGVAPEEVNAAISNMVKTGDKAAINDLMDKAASNLGMPSSAGLRDEILPSLGIKF